MKQTRWTDDELKYLMGARRDDISYREIALSLDRSERGTRQKAVDLGLTNLGIKEAKRQAIKEAKQNTVATVYLLDFGDFQKVGITQQPLKDRLRKFPKHDILDFYETDLEDAREIEKIVLDKAQKAIPNIPGFYRNGRTECIKTNFQKLEDFC